MERKFDECVRRVLLDTTFLNPLISIECDMLTQSKTPVVAGCYNKH